MHGSSIPFCLGYEGNVYWDTVQLLHGQNIYSPLSLRQCPWAVNIYPPGFMVAGAIAFKLFGQSLSVLRAVNALSIVITVGSLATILRLSGCKWLAIVVAIAALLSSPVSLTNVSIRVDQFALAVSVLSLLSFAVIFNRQKIDRITISGVVISSVVAVLACLSKQQSLVVPISIMIFCCFARRWKLAALFSIPFFALLLASGLMLDFTTDHGYFQHVLFLKDSGWDKDQFVSNLLSLRRESLFVGFGLSVAFLTRFGKSQFSFLHMPIFLCAVSVVGLLYSLGIPASGPNHAMTVVIGFIWLSANCLRRATPWMLVFFLASGCFFLPTIAAYPNVEPLQKQTQSILTKQLFVGKPVLSEDAYLNVVSNSLAQIVDPTTLLINWEKHDFLGPLSRLICSQHFAAIIINDEDAKLLKSKKGVKWPISVLRDIDRYYEANYAITGNGYIQQVFLPRKRFCD